MLNPGFDVYPNPTSGSFIVKCNLKDGKNSCMLSVKNALGQVVYSNNFKDVTSGTLTKEVDLSSQPKGIYLIEMEAGYDKEARKIIIE